MPGNKQVFSTSMSTADRHRWDSQWGEAAQEYQRALAEFPEDAGARGGLGFCYMQTKQWRQALNEYEYILARDPSNVIALSKTAELYGILHRRDEAYKAYLHLAELYSQAGQGARAEAAWQKAVQLSPGNPEPHERLATYYVGKRDIALMIQERLAAAQGYLQRKERASARVQCEEVLRADTTNAQAQLLLSQIMQPSGSLPQEATVLSTTGTGPADMANMPAMTSVSSGPFTFTGSPATEMVAQGNTSGGNTGIMGNMGSAGNFGGANNSRPNAAAASMVGETARKRITASQVTGALRQAQTFQTQGRFNDAISLCEQILESGFDRPDARYFLGWLYQEQQRWDEAIRQFQMLLNDPDYALSCYYALGQCYRARGDLKTATTHFDEAVDRVNLDALTVEESDQLVQLCQEAAEAHRLLGEQEQALTVYNALLGFLRSRGWGEKVAQVEFMLNQLQHAPMPLQPVSPLVPPAGPYAGPPQQANATRILPPEQMSTMAQPPVMPAPAIPGAAAMAFNVAPSMAQAAPAPATGSAGDLPDWLTGILSDADKTQISNKQPGQVPAQPPQPPQSAIANQPTMAQPMLGDANATMGSGERMLSGTQWSGEGSVYRAERSGADIALRSGGHSVAERGEMTDITMRKPMPPMAEPYQTPVPPVQPSPYQVPQPIAGSVPPTQIAPYPAAMPYVQPSDAINRVPTVPPIGEVTQRAPVKRAQGGAEDLLSQMAGPWAQDEALKHVAESVLASTMSLPENIRMQVVQSMQDIQKFINYGLLTTATEECLRVIDMAPQYLDVHQVLCEIYVREGKTEQAIAKYSTLVETYTANGRTEDAIATYRRILQLDPNNLTYRTRLINLLTTHGSKEELLRERSLVAESYLRLGYTERAVTELERALQETPTSVPTRLNYALALQKLARSQEAVAEYQRVLQVDPRNLTALVRWHIAMITGGGSGRSTTLETLSRLRWQLRGEGQRHNEIVVREYTQAAESYPNNADVHFALGQIHQQAGNFDKAIDSYMLAVRDNSLEAMARTSAAHCLLAQGKPEAAIQQLEQALQAVRRSASGAMDPSVWAARPREDGEEHQAPKVEISTLLAKAYERAGKRDQMQAVLRQLKQTTTSKDEVASTLAEISSHRGDVNATLLEYIELARQYRSKRQIENALSVLNEMVRMAPQDPRAHAELGDIYVGRGLLEEGIAELRLLADVNLRRDEKEEASAVLRRIGNIYDEMGNTDEALTNFRRAAELDGSDMDLLREVVGFCWRTGKTKDAAHYQTAIARYYFETHQVKESVAALQQLITIDRKNFDAYDMLGQTYQSVGEYEQASRVYKNLAKINSGSSLAQERLATLRELRSADQ